MHINKQGKNRLRIIIATALLLICVVLSVAFLVHRNNANQNKGIDSPTNNTSDLNNIDYDPPTDEQLNAARDNDVKSQDPGSPPSNGSPITASFTALSQNGSVLQARVLIHELLGSGTCALTLTKQGAATVTDTANLQPLPSSTTCQGFNTPTDNMEKGVWKITVKVSSGDRSGSVEKDIEIK